MKKVALYIITFLLILLAGCQSINNLQWFDSKNKAIEYGLKQEEVDKTAILSIEDYEGEEIIFYEKESALGVASIIESEKGFSWYRNNHYHGFETDNSYITVDFNFTTNTGKDVLILAGRVFDSTIQKMKITNNGLEREIKINGNSGLFYLIHKTPFRSLKITPNRD